MFKAPKVIIGILVITIYIIKILYSYKAQLKTYFETKMPDGMVQ